MKSTYGEIKRQNNGDIKKKKKKERFYENVTALYIENFLLICFCLVHRQN